MPDPVVLRTDRLVLRPWREEDREPFAAMNADPDVMEHFPALMTKEQSDSFVDRIRVRFAADGYGLWAVEIAATGEFAGFVGLNRVPPAVPVRTAGEEIGWRLARPFWGQGLATEAAMACLDYGFSTVDLPEIVSFTATTNQRSQRVMQRIGMTRDPGGDFDHPSVPEGHRVRPHVLYRLANPRLSPSEGR